MTNRRIFMMTLVAGGSALGTASAVAQAKLDPNSPQAKSLGYVDDTAKADAKKAKQAAPAPKAKATAKAPAPKPAAKAGKK